MVNILLQLSEGLVAVEGFLPHDVGEKIVGEGKLRVFSRVTRRDVTPMQSFILGGS